MRKHLFIAIGGILGAVLRYLTESIHIYRYHGNIPLNTLTINVAGSFFLALILTVAFEILPFDTNVRLGIATGFLGAFTTFSTLCKETVGLLREGFYFSALSYITVSTVLGLAAVYFGMVLAREAVSKLVKKIKEKDGKIHVEENGGGE